MSTHKSDGTWVLLSEWQKQTFKHFFSPSTDPSTQHVPSASKSTFLLCTNGFLSKLHIHWDTKNVNRSLVTGWLTVLPKGQQFAVLTWHFICKWDVDDISMVSREYSVIHTSIHDNKKHSIPTELFNQLFQEREACFRLTDACVLANHLSCDEAQNPGFVLRHSSSLIQAWPHQMCELSEMVCLSEPWELPP